MSLQVENGGYTRIVNEVLDQLVKTPLLGSEWSLLVFVIRKTWGFNKKEDVISLSQFEQALDVSRHTVINGIKNLAARRILVKRSIPGRQEIAYSFNKYWREWLVHTTAPVQNKMPTSAIERFQLVKRSAHTKDNTKENKSGYKNFLKRREQLARSKAI